MNFNSRHKKLFEELSNNESIINFNPEILIENNTKENKTHFFLY